MTAFDAICDSLATVTGNGTRRNARCPAHEDHTPSLSVTATEDRVLIHCHAGCSTDEVLTALNLTVRDLYNEPRGGDLAQYQYTDVHGKPTRIVHRREG